MTFEVFEASEQLTPLLSRNKHLQSVLPFGPGVVSVARKLMTLQIWYKHLIQEITDTFIFTVHFPI